MDPTEPVSKSLARGAVAGLSGAAVMTAFQKWGEMPVTKRKDSFAPAMLAEKLLPIGRKRGAGRRRLNYAVHFGLGTGWGLARAAAGRAGLKGPAAIGAIYAGVYPADVLAATVAGVYEPRSWTSRGTAIDMVDKLVCATATGVVYDLLERRSTTAS